MAAILELEGVCAHYGRIQALRDVSLRVEEGEVVTIIGANGAGKSTTLMAISGILRPMAGQVVYDGQDTASIAPEKLPSMGLCQVPEGRRILTTGVFLRPSSWSSQASVSSVTTTITAPRNSRCSQPGWAACC